MVDQADEFARVLYVVIGLDRQLIVLVADQWSTQAARRHCRRNRPSRQPPRQGDKPMSSCENWEVRHASC